MRILLLDKDKSRYQFISRKTLHDVVWVDDVVEFLRLARGEYFDRVLIDSIDKSSAESLVMNRGCSLGARIIVHGQDKQAAEETRYILSDGTCDVYADPWADEISDCLEGWPY